MSDPEGNRNPKAQTDHRGGERGHGEDPRQESEKKEEGVRYGKSGEGHGEQDEKKAQEG